jgi:lipoyl(octanoyl) transferase
MSADTPPIIIKHLGLTNFSDTCDQMQAFTAARTADTADEIWLTEHSPVYSLGLNRKNVRLPIRDDIPVVNCDRGGKITYHGPGQIVMYVLLDLARYGLNIRQLVSMLEDAVITTLSQHGVSAEAKKDAPGVYVNEAKIASLGLRMKKNYCYHGLSLNLNMDLTPFKAIDPCGYAGLAVSKMADLGIDQSFEAVSNQLVTLFQAQLCTHQLP